MYYRFTPEERLRAHKAVKKDMKKVNEDVRVLEKGLKMLQSRIEYHIDKKLMLPSQIMELIRLEKDQKLKLAAKILEQQQLQQRYEGAFPMSGSSAPEEITISLNNDNTHNVLERMKNAMAPPDRTGGVGGGAARFTSNTQSAPAAGQRRPPAVTPVRPTPTQPAPGGLTHQSRQPSFRGIAPNAPGTSTRGPPQPEPARHEPTALQEYFMENNQHGQTLEETASFGTNTTVATTVATTGTTSAPTRAPEDEIEQLRQELEKQKIEFEKEQLQMEIQEMQQRRAQSRANHEAAMAEAQAKKRRAQSLVVENRRLEPIKFIDCAPNNTFAEDQSSMFSGGVDSAHSRTSMSMGVVTDEEQNNMM